MSLLVRNYLAAHLSRYHSSLTLLLPLSHTVILLDNVLNYLHDAEHRSASPGKLADFEESIFRSAEMSETPVVMAVTLALVEGARTVRLGLRSEVL